METVSPSRSGHAGSSDFSVASLASLTISTLGLVRVGWDPMNRKPGFTQLLSCFVSIVPVCPSVGAYSCSCDRSAGLADDRRRKGSTRIFCASIIFSSVFHLLQLTFPWNTQSTIILFSSAEAVSRIVLMTCQSDRHDSDISDIVPSDYSSL